MTGPTHILVGFSIAVAAGRVFGHTPTTFDLCMLLIGSLAPDIDADSGSITRPGRLFGRFISRRAAMVLDELGQVVGKIAQLISGHRGFFHWPILGVLMVSIGALFGYHLLIWFGIGYLGHLFADACTVYGIPIWAPLSYKNISIARVRVGSPFEAVLFSALLVLMVTFGWELLPERTQEGFKDLRRVVERKAERLKAGDRANGR